MESLAAMSPAVHPVRTRLVVSAIAWILAYFAVQYVLDELHPTPPWDMVVASVPVFMFYLFAWAVQSGLRQADELQRRIHLEALAMAFLIVMVAAMFLGLMEDSPRGHLWFRLRDLWLAMLPLYAICYAAAYRHYR
jgi:hypothetical protein